MNLLKSKFKAGVVDHSKGFTIVELLIVIVVIAILAAISLVAFNNVQARAQDSVNKSDISTIVKKLELYRSETDSWPIVEAYPPCDYDMTSGISVLELPKKITDKLCVSSGQWCSDGGDPEVGVQKNQICFAISSGMNAGSSWYVTISYWENSLNQWQIIEANMDIQNAQYDDYDYTPRSGGSGNFPDPNFGLIDD